MKTRTLFTSSRSLPFQEGRFVSEQMTIFVSGAGQISCRCREPKEEALGACTDCSKRWLAGHRECAIFTRHK